MDIVEAEPTLHPTDEQTLILDLVRDTTDNLLINALAGTGKTATLCMICDVAPQRPILYLAFNKRVVEEAVDRFPDYVEIRTFNACGHRIWARACAKGLRVEPKKTAEQVRGLIDELPRGEPREEAWNDYHLIINSVGRAKALGYIPTQWKTAKSLITREEFLGSLEERPTTTTAALIDGALLLSIRSAYDGAIDFNDQIYMPALFGGTFPRFPLVLIDEAQDLSPTNHALLNRLCKASRVIAVGDPWQSIYGFRGAVRGGMSALRDRFAMRESTLSISFRCPRRIVENARWRVPEFKWYQDGGLVGIYRTLRAADIHDSAAIICRNNAPLFALAFNLLSSGRSVSVAGSDIGPRVVGTLRKLGDQDLPRSAVLSAIQAWLSGKIAKGSTTAEDMAACMVIMANHGTNLGQACAYAEYLFKQRGSIQLMTGHKAKGLEFDVVYHLDPWLIGDSDQELNLRYVIQTRARSEFYTINSRDIQW